MARTVVITGVGMVTPLGQDAGEVLRRIEAGESAAARPRQFEASPFACPVCAEVADFEPQRYLAEPKMSRLMNRDALFAVAAARLALRDAAVRVGTDYAPQAVALFGATGLAGLPLREVRPLIKASVGTDGGFDLARFGQAGLRSISPLLSFKILSNMPVCFVSICENIQGPNAIYTPWEGQGAQAIEAGRRAIVSGEAQCAVVGGCDVKTHELAFISLEQQGLFESWRRDKAGIVPGEGAVFLVLEEASQAVARGARVYARLANLSIGTRVTGSSRAEVYQRVLKNCLAGISGGVSAVIGAADGDPGQAQAEAQALGAAGISGNRMVCPKQQAGNLFAAAAALQVGVGALIAARSGEPVLANCFGHGSEQASFYLEHA